MIASPTQVAASVPFDNEDTTLISDDVQAVILELRLSFLVTMINASARLIKTQRITAEIVLRGQTL